MADRTSAAPVAAQSAAQMDAGAGVGAAPRGAASSGASNAIRGILSKYTSGSSLNGAHSAVMAHLASTKTSGVKAPSGGLFAAPSPGSIKIPTVSVGKGKK